jgi:hypothetical protein
MEKITYNGKQYDFDAAVGLMDDDLREHIHSTIEQTVSSGTRICADQEFFDAYVKAHADKFGEEFVIN